MKRSILMWCGAASTGSILLFAVVERIAIILNGVLAYAAATLIAHKKVQVNDSLRRADWLKGLRAVSHSLMLTLALCLFVVTCAQTFPAQANSKQTC
jgi:hypothetical protein